MSDFLPIAAGLAAPTLPEIAANPADGAQPDDVFAKLLASRETASPAALNADQPANLSAPVSSHVEFCQLASMLGVPASKPLNRAVSAEAAEVITVGSGAESDEAEQTAARTDNGGATSDPIQGLAAAPEINVTLAQAQAVLVPVGHAASPSPRLSVGASDPLNARVASPLAPDASFAPGVAVPEPKQSNGLNADAKPVPEEASSLVRPRLIRDVEYPADRRLMDVRTSIEAADSSKLGGMPEKALASDEDPVTTQLMPEVPTKARPSVRQSTEAKHSPTEATSHLAQSSAAKDETHDFGNGAGNPSGQLHAKLTERTSATAVPGQLHQVTFDAPARSSSQAVHALHALSEIATPSASPTAIIHAAAPLAQFLTDFDTSGAAPVPIAGLAVEIAARAREGERRFEIRLDPPELGRIDVRLDFGRDGQVTSRLVVERAETLDLLRRDAAALERALQSAGLQTNDGAMQFSLRDHSGGRWASFEQSARPSLLIVPDADVTVREAVRRGYGALRGLGAGVDISV